MSDYADKVRSLGFPRQKGGDNVKRIQREDNGKLAGIEIEHWDDSQDAIARPATLKYKMGQGGVVDE